MLKWRTKGGFLFYEVIDLKQVSRGIKLLFCYGNPTSKPANEVQHEFNKENYRGCCYAGGYTENFLVCSLCEKKGKITNHKNLHTASYK